MASISSRSKKSSSIKLRRTSSKQELNLNEILCLMTNNEVTQLEAQIFLEEKYGEEKIEWMKMSNQQLQKLAAQSKEFKAKQSNYISNRLFIREMKQSEKGINQRLRNGTLLDNLRTTIISYELLLDHTTDPQHRKAIINAVKSLKQEHAVLQLGGSPSQEMSKRNSVKKEKPLTKKLRRIFSMYSGRGFHRARNSLFDDHKQGGLNLQNFSIFLKQYNIQRQDITRQLIIKIFQTNSSNKVDLNFEQFCQALYYLKDILSRNTPDTADNEFAQSQPLDEDQLLPILDVDQLVEQGYKKQFEISREKKDRWSSRNLAPHSGRLQFELEDQLEINKGKRIIQKLRVNSEAKKSEKQLKLPSIFKIKQKAEKKPSKKKYPRLQPEPKLKIPETALSKEAQLCQLLGIQPQSKDFHSNLKEQIAKQAQFKMIQYKSSLSP